MEVSMVVDRREPEPKKTLNEETWDWKDTGYCSISGITGSGFFS